MTYPLAMMSISRTISIVLAVAFIVYACLLDPPGLAVVAVGYMVIPMGAIWFGDELGSSTGHWFGGGYIDVPSPGIIVKFLGWILLCLTPVVVLTFKWRLELGF